MARNSFGDEVNTTSRLALETLGTSPIDSTSKIGYIRVESKKIMSAVYLPYIYTRPMFTSPVYIGEVNSGHNFFLTLTLYIPNFTLTSDLVSDLGVINGLFEVRDIFSFERHFALFSGILLGSHVQGHHASGSSYFSKRAFESQSPGPIYT